jgi:hypothetical protein
MGDGKKLNFVQRVHEAVHIQNKRITFNQTATCDILMYVFINFIIPAIIVIKRFIDVVL